MKSYILKYNGDGATPEAIINEPANGFQLPNAAVVQPDVHDHELDAAVKHWVTKLADPDSGLANCHITISVENSGPNVGDTGDGGE